MNASQSRAIFDYESMVSQIQRCPKREIPFWACMIAKYCKENGMREEFIRYAALAIELVSSVDCEDLIAEPYRWIKSLSDKEKLEIYEVSCYIEDCGSVWLKLYERYYNESSNFDRSMSAKAREMRALTIFEMREKLLREKRTDHYIY